MITVSEGASKEFIAYFEDKEKTPIRIYLAPGGCSGPRLALALDEPGEEDTTFEDNGLTFCINTELLTSVGSVAIEMSPMGFMVEPEIPLPGGGGGCCASSGGGCGSGCGGSGGGCH
ncbi:MAG: IscA/HesB family protein [Bilophila sp.]